MKTVDEISKEKELERKEEFKKKISKDIKDIVSETVDIVNKSLEDQKLKKVAKNNALKKKNKGFWIFKKIGLGLAYLIAILFVINFTLGNVWLLKYFISNIF